MDMFLEFKKYAIFYNLDKKDTKKLWDIIKPVCEHKEFIKRMNKPFYHHDIKMLGEHIMSDAIVTYKYAIKKNINVKYSVLIAMFHDLYEEPWQNNPKKKKLFNKHGFVHPIEAVINAITWYPEYFKDIKVAELLIDGIIHHMYPFPVRILDNTNIELNNVEKYNKLDDRYKELIKKSLGRNKIGKISLSKSYFKEGRIMAKADKYVCYHTELKGIKSLLTLTGKNKKLDNYKNKSSK